MFNTSSTTRAISRSRWAAIGAAVAVCLGGGGLGIVNAAINQDDGAVFQAIDPCRITDTRPGADNVGGRATPIGDGESYTLNAWGAIGNCSDAALPPGITALSLNVTALNPTMDSYVTLFPAGTPLPVVSHVNPSTRVAAPLPNAVTVDLNASGDFTVYNHDGTVDLIIDVVGIYDDDVLDNAVISDGGKVAYAYGCATAASAPIGGQVNLSAVCFSYDYNPNGQQTISTHTAVGVYTIAIPGLDMTKGTAQVTAYGNTSNHCNVSSWSPNGAVVKCYDTAGTATNTPFVLMMMD